MSKINSNIYLGDVKDFAAVIRASSKSPQPSDPTGEQPVRVSVSETIQLLQQ